MTRGKKRALILAVVAVVALIASIAGYAYWSTTGSGTASSTAGTTATVTITGSFTTGIYPGGTKTVSFTATNPNPGTVRVGTVTLASVTTTPSSCAAADFTMPDVAENADVPTGGPTALPTNGTLTFANTSSNQDTCKGATIQLNLTSN